MRNYLVVLSVVFFPILLFPFIKPNKVNAKYVSHIEYGFYSDKRSNDVTKLKEMRVKLVSSKNREQIFSERFSLLLKKGNSYRFNLRNEDGYNSRAILELYYKSELINVSCYDKSKMQYSSFDFICKKTGVYKVQISFEKGKEGCATGVLSLINK